jgi:type IV pilus assembly protein PilE
MIRNGFSLLELLVTLAIIALLTTLAWPGYAAAVQRAHRNDARLALLALQHAQERHYQSFNAYSDTLGGSAAGGGLGLDKRSAAGSYALAISISADAQHYTATASAVPGGRQAADAACAQFRIDEKGQRTATGTGGGLTTAQCWR